MKQSLSIALLILGMSYGCYAQATQPPATPDELQYLSFMLMEVASIDHSPDAIHNFGGLLVQQFGLSADEAVVIHTAGQTLNSLLQTLRQSQRSIMAGKTALSAADASALAALAAQRQELISTLANQILNSVRPGTANLLRAQGHVLAAGLKAAQGVH
jgi:uncharacterized protein (DUF885 family)